MKKAGKNYLDFEVDKLTNSIENAISGEVFDTFIAKSKLIEHYQQTLGAKLFGGNRMYIDTKEALILTTKYFKDFTI